MKKILYRLIVFSFIATNSFGQEYLKREKYDFHPPMKIPLILSSNFGELRPNHFHMGLDFKTNNREGYNLYSIEDGFVSRIKVSPYGYGKVVYIDHPNGLTSVYAHCSEFKGKVDSIVRVTQEREQNYAVEIFPKPGEISLKKGERFALSGNSGGSTAPHLHFEIRDTKTEAAMNPNVFGFSIADHKKPEIRRIKLYGITKEGYRIPGKSKETTVRLGKTRYYVEGGEISVPANYISENGGIGIAVDVIDRYDGAGNQCGLYGSTLIVDGDTVFGQEINYIPFESTRYVNCHKDFQSYSAYRRKYHKCFHTQENPLPIYTFDDLGVLKFKPNSEHQIEYIAYDVTGNTSVLKFKIKVLHGKMYEGNYGVDSLYLLPSETETITTDERVIELGLATTYEPIIIAKKDIAFKIGEKNVPVQNAYRIKMKSDFPNDGKNYVEVITTKNRKKAVEVGYDSGWYYCDSKYFGTYKMKRDTIAPVFAPVNFSSSKAIPNSKVMKWSLKDVSSGIADYDIFIDGKWHLLEYDYKGGGYVLFRVPESFSGKKEVKLIFKDQCGNVKTWSKTITFL